MSHHIVEARGLCHTCPDGHKALSDISFRITHGQSVAVVGANGAGKSTLLLHLNGCLTPTSGEVRIGDYPVTGKTLCAVRRSVGMVFQDPDDQLFMPTVFDDVAFGPLNLGLPPDEVKSRVQKALEDVGAGHLADRAPHHLSGGEKRAVSIATVLSMRPDILVMDEPTSHLDPRSRRLLIAQLKGFEHTRIIATHDLDLVMDVCEQTIILKDGRMHAQGPTRELLTDEPLLVEAGLELPLRLQGRPVCNEALP